MDVDRAIAIIQTILAPKALIPVQIQIIRGTISDKSYQEMIVEIKKTDVVRSQGYKLSYIKETGGRLWQSLSVKLDRKVTKTNLLAILLWYTKQSEFNLVGQICVDAQTATQIDWGERNQRGFDSGSFYGRETELKTLTNWCLIDRCRLISVLGMGGIGKTSLIEKVVSRLKANFDFVIWRSLLNAPPLVEVFSELLQFLTPPPQLVPTSVEAQIELLITYFTRNRCLVVLDNAESILQAQAHSGQYLQGYDGYGQIFRAIGELNHQSCLLLTSREKPATIARSEVIYPQLVKSLAVGGLTANSAKKLIRSCGCPPVLLRWWKEIYAHYQGNPFALKIVVITAAEMILDHKIIAEFYQLMQKGKFQFKTIDDLLQRQFDRLSPVEQELVYWLAIEREPVTRKELCLNLFSPQTVAYSTLDALTSLSRRCIAVRQQETWSMEPVMIAYATSRLIDKLTSELGSELVEFGLMDLAERFFHLNSYAIVKAQAKDYLRRAMVQLILRPILDRLLKIWQTPVALARHLKNILAGWQSQYPIPLGYLAGNILNLLIELAPDRSIKDLDCSLLPIWSAYLVDVRLYHVNFAACRIDRTLFTQAFGGIVSVVVHPTKDLFATGDGNGDVHLWRMSDGQKIATYQEHTSWIRALVFTPDGTILVSSSDDLSLCCWEITTGKKLLSLEPPHYSFRRVSFSRDGQKLITGCNDNRVRIYNFPQLLAEAVNLAIKVDPLQELTLHTNWVFSVSYSPDQTKLATASADGTVRIWDLATGNCLQILSHTHWAIRTFFSLDGSQLYVSGMSATIYVWDTVTGILLQTLTGHRGLVWSISLSPDGNTLASAGEDRTIRLWNVNTGICRSVFRAHQQRIWAIDFTPDGQQLISGSEDRTIRIWDLHREKCLKTIDGYGDSIKSIVFVPDRDWLISGHHDGMIRIWNVQNFTCIHTLEGHTEGVLSISLSPNGRNLVSCSFDQTVRLWDLQELTCVWVMGVEIQGNWSLNFSADGAKLIGGVEAAKLQIWEVATGILISTLDTEFSKLQSVAICQVTGSIATASEDIIKIWDSATGKCTQSFKTNQRNHSIVFSPDGRYLAGGSMNTTAKVWDTTNWQCIQTFSGHRGWIMTVAFSPNLDCDLITGSCDRTIKRWNLSTGKCLQTYLGHRNWVWSIGYSQDGRLIASASEDGTINIWDIDTPQPLHTLQLKPPYQGTNITGSTGLLFGQRQTLQLLGAIES